MVEFCFIYYFHPFKQNGFRNSLFIDGWSKYLDNVANISYDVIINCDLKLCVDNKSDIEAHRFCSKLDSHRLTRHVNGSTDKEGHTLDLVMPRELSSIQKQG